MMVSLYNNMSADKIQNHWNDSDVNPLLKAIFALGKAIGQVGLDEYAAEMPYSKFPDNLLNFQAMLIEMKQAGEKWDDSKWSSDTAVYKR